VLCLTVGVPVRSDILSIHHCCVCGRVLILSQRFSRLDLLFWCRCSWTRCLLARPSGYCDSSNGAIALAQAYNCCYLIPAIAHSDAVLASSPNLVMLRASILTPAQLRYLVFRTDITPSNLSAVMSDGRQRQLESEIKSERESQLSLLINPTWGCVCLRKKDSGQHMQNRTRWDHEVMSSCQRVPDETMQWYQAVRESECEVVFKFKPC
jgi:hypothetical protein